MTARRPCVVVVSGLNGTGKTTLANRLRAHLGARDTMLIADAVAAGTSVVVEGVFADDFRDSLIEEATRANARVVTVECECSDGAVHRQRVHDRWQRGDSPISWEAVTENKAIYRRLPVPDYRADAIEPIDTHLIALVGLLETEP